MRRLAFLFWLLFILAACGGESAVDAPLDPTAPTYNGGFVMPVPISALDPASFSTTWGTPPDEGTKAKADDVRQLAELALTNEAYLYQRGVRAVAQYQAVKVSFGEIASKTDGGEGDPVEAVGVDPIQVDIDDTVDGSVLLIDVTAHVKSETSVGATGLLGARVVEDVDGSASNVDVPGSFTEWEADDVRRKEILTAMHVITAPGKARVRLRLGGPSSGKKSSIVGYLTIRVSHVRPF